MSAPELQLLGEIASGGMGSVQLGRLRDAGSGERLVAFKRMHPEYAKDPDFVRMFKDEIFLTGSVRHPSVVGLIGWGEDQDGPYLLMEYIEGVAFGHAIDAGRDAGDVISPELVAWVAARVGEGLFAAQSMKDGAGRSLEIVHRDITPSNVLIGFDGAVKITDFGIAKATVRTTHTRTGTIKGKIAYMSPEYAAKRVADGRSDLYSLGVVMFEALSGAVPFHARGDLELLKLVAYAVPPSLASMAPEVDPALVRVVDRLLSKDPNARFKDGATLASELDAFCATRGFDFDRAKNALAEYVRTYGSGRREALRQLRDESALTRALDTATFTFFDTETTRRKPATVQPQTAKKTRKVAQSEAPPPPSLDVAPKIPAAPPLPTFRGAAESSPVSVDRPPLPGPQRSPRPLLIVASILGIVGIVVSIALALPGQDPDPASADPLPPPPPLPEVVTTPPALTTPVPVVTTPAPTVSETVPEVTEPEVTETLPTTPEPPVTAKKPSRVGTKPKQPSNVPAKPKTPCTPDRFDYPACLKQR
jgi:serine/threonine protein kinase